MYSGGLKWVQSGTQPRGPQYQVSISKMYFGGNFWEQRRQVKHISETGEWWSPPLVWVHPARGSAGSQIFLMTSSSSIDLPRIFSVFIETACILTLLLM